MLEHPQKPLLPNQPACRWYWIAVEQPRMHRVWRKDPSSHCFAGCRCRNLQNQPRKDPAGTEASMGWAPERPKVG
jgi:hypothetical protein